MAQDRSEGGTAQSSSMRDRAADQAQQTAEQAKSLVEQARERAKEHTQTVLDQQKSAAADQIGGLASALHQTADSLEQQNYGFIAQYTERAARSLEDMAESLRARDINELIGQCEQLARRQPALFVGSTVALGFAFARFFKSSAEHGYATDYGSGSGYASSSGYGSHAASGRSDDAGRSSPSTLAAASGSAGAGVSSSGAGRGGAQSGGTAAALGGGYGAPPESAGSTDPQTDSNEQLATASGAGLLADPSESPVPGPRPTGYAGATPTGENRNDQSKKTP